MPKSKRTRRSKSISGYFGVKKISSGKYQADIHINGKHKYIGAYDTAKEASKVYDKEAIKLRKPLCSLNYPTKAPVGYTPFQQPLYSNNTVGYRGVRKTYGKYQARIRVGGLMANRPTLVRTRHPKKQPLPTIALF